MRSRPENKRKRPVSYEIHQPGGLFEPTVAGERRRVAANRARLKAAKGGSIRKGRRLPWEGAA